MSTKDLTCTLFPRETLAIQNNTLRSNKIYYSRRDDDNLLTGIWLVNSGFNSSFDEKNMNNLQFFFDESETSQFIDCIRGFGWLRARGNGMGPKNHVIWWWIFNVHIKIFFWPQRPRQDDFFSTVTLNKYFNKQSFCWCDFRARLLFGKQHRRSRCCKYLCVHLMNYLFMELSQICPCYRNFIKS